jgi:hypothetical protein
MSKSKVQVNAKFQNIKRPKNYHEKEKEGKHEIRRFSIC